MFFRSFMRRLHIRLAISLLVSALQFLLLTEPTGDRAEISVPEKKFAVEPPVKPRIEPRIEPPVESSVEPSFQFRNTNVTYYTISGSSVEKLNQEMRRKGPHGWFAYTEWNYLWKNGKPTMECTVTMPLLTSKVTPAFSRKWALFWGKLALHEQGHVDIALDEFNKVKEKIGKTNNLSYKRELLEALDRSQKRSDNYDAETDHGVKQGAILAN